MIQKNEVLTQEDNRISLISTKRTKTQEDHPTIAERKMPVNTSEQTWIFEVGEKTRVSRTTPKLVNILVKIIKWLNHLGSGKIDDNCLESRHNIHHNIRIKGIGL
jgi:hypothetical protein